MEFTAKSGNPEKQRTACVVVGVFEPRRLSPAAERLDEISEGFISNLMRRGDMEGKIGQTLLLHNAPNTLCDRILLVGCGRERDLHDAQYRQIIGNTTNTLNDIGAMEAVSYLTELHVKSRDSHWNIRQAVETTSDALYTFDNFKSKKDATRRPLRKMVLSVNSRRDLASSEKAVKEGNAIALGVTLAKDLGNMPGNICTPSYLAAQGNTLDQEHDNIMTQVLSQSDLEQLEMGSFLSVAKGSRQPPKLIVINYRGDEANNSKPIVFVGKGVTFDSGGVSLKPGAGMDEMKYDMCGAAGVFGLIKAVAELELPINVIGVVPACENMPDGAANKPGDIVTSMSGQTIEILNTDAEGRLILCDALTYSERFDPEVVIDIATLTGACVVALGRHPSGVLGNHSPLVHDLLNAGKTSGDRIWELPLWEEYQEQLNSPFADMANIGGREAGTITAACFLSRFTKKFHWAHLDIAGTAWKSGEQKGSTGRPVPLLTQYLLDCCANK